MWRETSFSSLDAVVQDVIASPFDGPSGRPLVLSQPASGGELHESTLARIQVRSSYCRARRAVSLHAVGLLASPAVPPPVRRLR